MRKLLIAALAVMGMLICTSNVSAQVQYQPVGNHVAYGDGSTDFYFKVTNPSTGQVQSITVFFYCSNRSATVIGDYNVVAISGTCLVPPNGGTVTVTPTGSGSVTFSGMTVTVNPSTWTIEKGARGIEFVVSSNVPLTVQ